MVLFNVNTNFEDIITLFFGMKVEIFFEFQYILQINKFKFKFNILFPCHFMYKHTYMAIKHKNSV